jgi:O-acetylserine/cysteine efflux transporter
MSLINALARQKGIAPSIGWLDFFLAVVVSACWGMSVTISKIGVNEIPPLFLLALRFSLVAVMIVPWVRIPIAHVKSIVALSVTLGLIHFSTMFIGLKFVDASTAAIVQQLQTPFAVIIAAIVLNERPGWKRILGIVFAFAGVVIIAGRPTGNATSFGMVLMVIAAVFWALGSVQMKVMSGVSPLAANAWLAVFAAPQLFLSSYLLETNQITALRTASWTSLGSILYLAFITTLLGYGIWYRLMRRHDVSLVMPFTLLIPIFGVASSVAFLGEELNPQFLVGSAVTLFGLALTIFQKSRSGMGRANG